ncbi:hypothetical protein CTEN210_08385 [Chaetoceros tenuissimus]|uniref:Peptidase S1 domain-containing protein n=1 Tax=Chaetoceros tenuissimus TaxID=426638 RepID=A0AAD3CU74_9STRA|nr:hypothetical protein CTEN210_08385 [Chaetoceros tenuissimus]
MRFLFFHLVLSSAALIEGEILPGVLGLSDEGRKRRHRRAIVNGKTVPHRKYPYASSVKYGNIHLCGASLIAPDLILSAAHCYNNDGPNQNWKLKVTVGEYHLQDLWDDGETFSVEHIDIHPAYEESSQYLINDVMVMKLNGKSANKIVKLNKDERYPVLNIGDPNGLTVFGWGSLDVDGNVMSNVLQEVSLGYISNNDCMSRGLPVVFDEMMCAVDIDGDDIVEDNCFGDSGSPLILSDSTVLSQKKDVQVGIVSYGGKKCGDLPGVYTRVSSVFEWIRDIVCTRSSQAPLYFRCEELLPSSNPSSNSDLFRLISTNSTTSDSNATPSNASFHSSYPTGQPSFPSSLPSVSPIISTSNSPSSIPFSNTEVPSFYTTKYPTQKPSNTPSTKVKSDTPSNVPTFKRKKTKSYSDHDALLPNNAPFLQDNLEGISISNQENSEISSAVYFSIGRSISLAMVCSFFFFLN